MSVVITNKAGEVKGESATIMAYFGRRPEQSLNDFNNEIKALTPEGKTELAVGAAKEMGWTVTTQ